MKKQLLYLPQADRVATELTIDKTIDLLEVAFYEKGHEQIEMPPKPGIHPGEGHNFIHAMPAGLYSCTKIGWSQIGQRLP